MADRSYAPDIILGLGAALLAGYFINANANVSIGGSTDYSGDGGIDPTDLGTGSTLTAWAQAIQNFENVNPAYNNPGGINENGDAGQTPNGIAMYSTWQVGYNRLLTLLGNMVNKNPSMTLDQATQYYAFGNVSVNNLSPSQQQVLANYQASVQQSLGLDGSTPISWIGGA
jgi:hypothetical protein